MKCSKILGPKERTNDDNYDNDIELAITFTITSRVTMTLTPITFTLMIAMHNNMTMNIITIVIMTCNRRQKIWSMQPIWREERQDNGHDMVIFCFTQSSRVILHRRVFLKHKCQQTPAYSHEFPYIFTNFQLSVLIINIQDNI